MLLCHLIVLLRILVIAQRLVGKPSEEMAREGYVWRNTAYTPEEKERKGYWTT